jgi:hypothetical protein
VTRKQIVATSGFGLVIVSGLVMAAIIQVLTFPVQPTVGQNQQVGESKKLILVGGVERPVHDVQVPDSAIKRDRSSKNRVEKAKLDFEKMPKQRALDVKEDARIEKARDQILKGGEALSLFQVPSEFDLAKYKKNKAEYLSQYVPARVFQTAQPVEGVEPLKPVSTYRQKLVSGESVELAVKGKSGYPVTFVAHDLGAFENKLNVISVECDAEGIAKATYLATPGVSGLARVGAGSPGSSENVAFEIIITEATR